MQCLCKVIYFLSGHDCFMWYIVHMNIWNVDLSILYSIHYYQRKFDTSTLITISAKSNVRNCSNTILLPSSLVIWLIDCICSLSMTSFFNWYISRYHSRHVYFQTMLLLNSNPGALQAMIMLIYGFDLLHRLYDRSPSLMITLTYHNNDAI